MDEMLRNKEEFIKEIKTQIKKGKQLIKTSVESEEQKEKHESKLWKWNAYNNELLKRSFNISNNSYYNEYSNPIPSARTIKQAIKPISTLQDKVDSTNNEIQDRVEILDRILTKTS